MREQWRGSARLEHLLEPDEILARANALALAVREVQDATRDDLDHVTDSKSPTPTATLNL